MEKGSSEKVNLEKDDYPEKERMEKGTIPNRNIYKRTVQKSNKITNANCENGKRITLKRNYLENDNSEHNKIEKY